MRTHYPRGELSKVVKERMIKGEKMLMPDRLFITTSGTEDSFVLRIETRDKIGRTLTYFDCPPMKIGDTIDVGNLRNALLKFIVD